jgi:hypothetical protein
MHSTEINKSITEGKLYIIRRKWCTHASRFNDVLFEQVYPETKEFRNYKKNPLHVIETHTSNWLYIYVAVEVKVQQYEYWKILTQLTEMEL